MAADSNRSEPQPAANWESQAQPAPIFVVVWTPQIANPQAANCRIAGHKAAWQGTNGLKMKNDRKMGQKWSCVPLSQATQIAKAWEWTDHDFNKPRNCISQPSEKQLSEEQFSLWLLERLHTLNLEVHSQPRFEGYGLTARVWAPNSRSVIPSKTGVIQAWQKTSFQGVLSWEGLTRKPRHASVFRTHSDTQAVPTFHCIRMLKGIFSTCAPSKRADTRSTVDFKRRLVSFWGYWGRSK